MQVEQITIIFCHDGNLEFTQAHIPVSTDIPSYGMVLIGRDVIQFSRDGTDEVDGTSTLDKSFPLHLVIIFASSIELYGSLIR